MLKGFDITKAKAQEVDTELLKRRISTGKAIAFTGAGFSLGTKNVLGSTPPMAGELAKKLSLLCNLKKNNVCLHINGKIEGAEPEDLTSKIKLSDSSYLSPDSFVNSDWYYHFKKDLETASAIVFMGYSMYDMDVKKFLFENPELQEKTYFVVRDGADFKEIFTLRKYGHVLPIGVDRFSDLMKDVQKQSHEDGVIFTETLVKYEVFDTQTDFRDIDSEPFRTLLNAI